jgi:hypothetical protein
MSGTSETKTYTSEHEMYAGFETAADMIVNAEAQTAAHIAKTGKVYAAGKSYSAYGVACWRTWQKLTSAERIEFIEAAAAKLNAG